MTYTGARDRLAAFFANGGGYIGTSQSGTNFTFLTNGGLTAGTFRQGSATAGGGIARWTNTGGVASPITGAIRRRLLVPPIERHLLLDDPDRGRDRRSLSERPECEPDRADRAVRGRPVALPRLGQLGRRRRRAGHRPRQHHGGQPLHGFATNPFSRGDFERSWPLIATAALWSNLTDEP